MSYAAFLLGYIGTDHQTNASAAAIMPVVLDRAGSFFAPTVGAMYI
jgi:hypothetical protein